MYAFLFDKKSLLMLAAAMLVLSALLFGGGFLLGVQWGLPTAAVPPAAPAVPALAPRPAVPAVIKASLPAPGEPAFSLQVGAFARRENCDAAVAALASRGYQPYVVDLSGRSRVLHTVRIGRYDDREAAVQALVQFRHKERQPAVILPPGE